MQGQFRAGRFVMTRHDLWIEVRYRLVVLGSAAAFLALFWTVAGSSVHFAAAAPYMPPDYYDGQVTAWRAGASGLVGWVDTNSDFDCPAMVVWVDAGARSAYIAAGPVPAHAHHLTWLGQLQDTTGQPVALRAKPTHLAFYCYR